MAVDISEVLAMDDRAGQLLDRGPNDQLIKVTEQCVEKERRTHIYHNITGRLQNSTVAKVMSGPDPAIVDVVMGMDYASHVRDKGRTNIDADIAEADRKYQAWVAETMRELASF